MGNNGAMSGITALPTTYANAYVYLPAGAIVTASAAGFYYATFSSTTAATIFNNTYTPGTPATIPASPTAFATTGPGAFTGVITEISMASVTIPGNSMGVNGATEAVSTWGMTSSVNNKTMRVKFGGTAVTTAVLTTNIQAQLFSRIINRGVTGKQISSQGTSGGGLGGAAGASIYPAIDTTADVVLLFTGQNANAADNLVLEGYNATILRL
jgi:hypothetical protein